MNESRTNQFLGVSPGYYFRKVLYFKIIMFNFYLKINLNALGLLQCDI